jgi:hypothetical protein
LARFDGDLAMVLRDGVRHPPHDFPPRFSALKGSKPSRRSLIFRHYSAALTPNASTFIQNEYFVAQCPAAGFFRHPNGAGANRHSGYFRDTRPGWCGLA